MVAYFFVAATLSAVIPILFAFKMTIDRIRKKPQYQQQWISRFIMTVAMIELMPIILFVLGFLNMETGYTMAELTVPMAIIILTLVMGLIFIYVQRMNDDDVSTGMFRWISFAFVSVIPIISIVGVVYMLT